jgi:hypothetical protein
MTTKRGILRANREGRFKFPKVDAEKIKEEEFQEKLFDWVKHVIVDFGLKIKEQNVVDYKTMTLMPERFYDVETRIWHHVNLPLLKKAQSELHFHLDNTEDVLIMMQNAVAEYVVIEKVKQDGKKIAYCRLKSKTIPDRINESLYSAQCHVANEWASKIMRTILQQISEKKKGVKTES